MSSLLNIYTTKTFLNCVFWISCTTTGLSRRFDLDCVIDAFSNETIFLSASKSDFVAPLLYIILSTIIKFVWFWAPFLPSQVCCCEHLLPLILKLSVILSVRNFVALQHPLTLETGRTSTIEFHSFAPRQKTAKRFSITIPCYHFSLVI